MIGLPVHEVCHSPGAVRSGRLSLGLVILFFTNQRQTEVVNISAQDGRAKLAQLQSLVGAINVKSIVIL